MDERIKKYNEYGEFLERRLKLRYNPQAIKMVTDLSEVPENAIWPKRDLGHHLALCQALAMAKRDGRTVFMQKDDHWCWNPIIGLGHVKCTPDMESFDIVSKYIGIADHEAARKFFEEFPTLPYGKYIGLLVSPLQTAEFVPDLVLVNSNNAQLRAMIWGIKNQTGKLVDSSFDAIDSCIWSIVTPLLNGKYRITLPDPGDYERAGADEDEIILSVPEAKLDELINGLKSVFNMGMGYTELSRSMELDFSRPPFYNELFKIWGLDEGKDWKMKMPPMPEEKK